MDHLIGATDIAQRLGFEHVQSFNTMRYRQEDFPEPVALVGKTHVWSWPDVEAWAKSKGRLS